MNELVGKRIKIFVRNLSDKPIVYTGEVIAVSSTFITLIDRTNDKVIINLQDVIQIKGVEE